MVHAISRLKKSSRERFYGRVIPLYMWGPEHKAGIGFRRPWHSLANQAHTLAGLYCSKVLQLESFHGVPRERGRILLRWKDELGKDLVPSVSKWKRTKQRIKAGVLLLMQL